MPSRPTVLIQGPSSGIFTHTNLTLTGKATDKASPVTSVQVAVDAGKYASLKLGHGGSFSYVTHLSLKGSADGKHVVHFKALDRAGHASPVVNVSFTLDTRPPVVTTSSPAAGATLATSPAIQGRVKDSLADFGSLQVAVNAGAFRPVSLSKTGAFTFTPTLALDGTGDGPHRVRFQATDRAGNRSAVLTLPFTLATFPGVTRLATPQLAPGSCTGLSSTDNLTSDNTPTVLVAAPTGLAVTLLVNGQAVKQATAVNGEASFVLGPLADGTYPLSAARRDASGTLHAQSAALSVTVSTQAPPAPTFDLSAADAVPGSHSTSAARVSLVGQAEPGDVVTLVGTAITALASSSGTFQLPDVSLATGANTLTVQAEDLAGNTSQTTLTITRTQPTGQPNAVIVWNQATLEAIVQDASDPPHASRALAMVQAAVYDAVNAIAGTPAYYVKITAPAGASADAAVDAAAHDVLVYLYPAQQATIDALLSSQLAQLPANQATTDGETVGQAAGDAIIALRASDGFNAFVDFTPSSGPGQWQQTPPAYAEALDPQWATLQPFAMTSDSQFRPAGPPDLTSQAWADAVNEVKSLGAANSTTRTPDQTKIARFWADGAGTVTPPGHWNQIAEQVAVQQGDGLAADARLFAELDVALADAAIVAWDAKFTYTAWRPITVIQSGGDGVNPAVTADPTWQPLLVTPNFPEYVSGHSTFSATAATVLDDFFGPNVGFSDSVTLASGVSLTRSFTGFDQAAVEAGRSRIYGGIHFEFSDADGEAAGRALGAYVLHTFTVSQDTTPPQVTLTSVLPSGASATNLTLTGQVTDNLSGVKSLAVSVDGGAYAPLTFDPNTGKFSFATTFALDGSADGTHTIRFQGTDAAGNVSLPVSFTFALGTKAPTLALTSPTDGGTLASGAVLSGKATTSAAALVALGYAFDGGNLLTVPFNADGTFNQALDLSKLAPGAHTLVVTAQDAAGNSSSQTLNLTLAAPVALTVSSLTPASGSTEVGVTFRPRVDFSRPIDPTTLSSSNFFASDSTGATVPATIVPSDDGTYAVLFFSNPLPGASTITLTVDGSTIKAADGSLLDAADSGTPGSKLTSSFTTVNQAAVPGTTLVGIVADPGPDLNPMTVDDVAPGPDGVLNTADDVYKLPIAGATVYIIGHQDQAVTTDAQGRFNLTSVPTGDVKLVIDGRTATNAPAGIFFPEMVMDLSIKPGVVNTVMGSMGTDQEQAANAAVQGVYLPRLQTSILQPVSDTQVTHITADADAAPDLTPQQRQYLTLDVQPGSLVGFDGKKVTGGKVGISTVPPQLVKDMLPAGLLQHSFDITIQAPGVAYFSTPATLTMPNVFNAAPGTQFPFLSFDHTTGRLVFEGMMTVSADGLYVRSNPGQGVTFPGWHGQAPPGDQADGDPGNPCPAGSSSALGAAATLGGAMYDGASAVLGVADAVATVAKAELPSLASTTLQLMAGVDIVQSLVTAYQTNDPVERYLNIAKAVGSGILLFSPVGELGLAIRGTVALIGLYQSYEAGKAALDEAKAAAAQLAQLANSPPCDPSQQNAEQQLAARIVDDINQLGQDATNQIAILQNMASLAQQMGTILQDADPSKPDYGFTDQDIAQFIQDAQAYENDARQIDSQGGAWRPINDVIGALPGFIGGFSAPRYPAPPPLVSGGGGGGVSGFLPPPPPPVPPCQPYWSAEIGGLVLRGRTTGYGNISFFAGPEQLIRVRVYDPNQNDLGTIVLISGPSGSKLHLGDIPMLPLTGMPDADGDGLPDVAEFVIGSNPNQYSTAGNGVSDLAMVRQCLDPTGGTVPPTGPIASLPLQGEASAVTLAPAPGNATGQNAYVATGSYGLAIVDTSRFAMPVLLGQIRLPGHSTDVSVDAGLGIAAVASGAGGLNFVAVTRPSSPALLRTVPGNFTAVRVKDGVAYAASGSAVVACDLLTGDLLQSLPLGGNPITSLAVEGSTLYALDSGNVLTAVDLGGPDMTSLGSLSLPAGGGQLFVGGGIAYVGAGNGSGSGGFVTVDVSDPKNLQLLSGASATNIEGQALAANGSGLLVSVGKVQVILQGLVSALDVSNVSDPSDTGAFLTRFPLPAAPLGVTIGEGIAFVADGTSGLQVVNYEALDTRGVNPTATISLPASVIVGTSGKTPQVVEGSVVPILATVTDDVQVRDVELLLNGRVVASAVSFPYNFTAALPSIAANDSNSVTLQLRATDTGGNVGLSNLLTVQLVPDTFPPTLLASNLQDGSTHGVSFRAFDFLFSRSLDPATVSSTTFQLVGPNGPVAAGNIQLRHHNATVQVTFPKLSPGSYQFVIHAASVTDLAGHALGPADLVTNFQVVNFTITWINPSGGFWDDPWNWSTGVVPGADDDVGIDVPGGAAITFRTGNVTVNSLTSNNPFILSGGTLALATASRINGPFTFSGGTLAGGGDLTVTGLLSWSGGTMSGPGATLAQGGMTLSGGGTEILDGRTLDNYGDAAWGGQNNDIYLGDGATWNNEPGSVLDSQADGQQMRYNGGAAVSFSNQGTFKKSAGGSTTVNVPFNNSGSILIDSGTLTLQGGSSDSGTLSVAAGATLYLAGGTHAFGSGAALGGAGSLLVSAGEVDFNAGSAAPALSAVTVSGGTLNFNAGSTAPAQAALTLSGGTLNFSSGAAVSTPALTQTGGTLAGSDNLTVTGLLSWSGGTMSGPGATLAQGGMAISGGGTEILDGRTLDNYGSAAWGGQNNDIYLGDGAAWVNEPGSVLDSQADGQQMRYTGGAAVSFSNQGTFKKSAGGSTAVNVPVSNSGSILVNSGTLTLQGGSSDSGSFSVAAGATLYLAGGTHAFGSGAALGGAGSLLVSAGEVDFNAGSAAPALSAVTVSGGTLNFNAGSTAPSQAALSVSGGTLNFSSGAAVSTPALTQTGGTLAGSDNLTVTGLLSWSGGTMSGPGATLAQGGMAISGGGTEILDGRTLDNYGDAAWGGQNNDIYLGDGAAWVNEPGSVLDSQADGQQMRYTGGAAVSFSNQGAFKKSAGGSTAVNVPVSNSGSILAGSGTLALTSPPASTGTIVVQVGATLSISGNCTLGSAGALTVQVGGTAAGQYGTVAVSGAATLAGTLNATLANGYTPQAGDTIPFLSYASHTGQFDTVNVSTLPAGIGMTVAYNAGNVTLLFGNALQASRLHIGPARQPALTSAALAPVISAAIDRWAAGLTTAQLSRLHHMHFQITDLAGAGLGLEAGNTIWIDQNAAGFGWFLAASSASDRAFFRRASATELVAPEGSRAFGKMDLLSVVEHELGHALGLGHDQGGVMAETLAPGVRREPGGRRGR